MLYVNRYSRTIYERIAISQSRPLEDNAYNGGCKEHLCRRVYTCYYVTLWSKLKPHESWRSDQSYVTWFVRPHRMPWRSKAIYLESSYSDINSKDKVEYNSCKNEIMLSKQINFHWKTITLNHLKFHQCPKTKIQINRSLIAIFISCGHWGKYKGSPLE